MTGLLEVESTTMNPWLSSKGDVIGIDSVHLHPICMNHRAQLTGTVPDLPLYILSSQGVLFFLIFSFFFLFFFLLFIYFLKHTRAAASR